MVIVKSGPFLKDLWVANKFVTANQIFKKFPLLAPIKWLFIPPSILASYYKTQRMNRKALESRTQRRGNTKHLDHFEQLLPTDAPPLTRREENHIEVVTGHLVIAGYEPIASQIFCTLMFSLLEPHTLKLLVEEIRGEFKSYADIHADALAPLRFLTASLMETLRITVLSSNGMARVSPGAMVDGNYIDRGVSIRNHPALFLMLIWFLFFSITRFMYSTVFWRLRVTHGIFTTPTATDPSVGCQRTTHTGIPHSKTTRGKTSTHSARGRDHVQACHWPGVRQGCSLPRCFGPLTWRNCQVKALCLKTTSECTGCGRSRNSGFDSIRFKEIDKIISFSTYKLYLAAVCP